MARIEPIAKTQQDFKGVELLEVVREKMGTVPNMLATMANSPAVLSAYLAFNQALSSGVLSPRIREMIALTVGEINGSKYCLAGHTAMGLAAGLALNETLLARRHRADHPKEQAILSFVTLMVENNGLVGKNDLDDLRNAGCSDAEVCELIAHVTLNIFTNYFNLVAQTEVDFETAPELDKDVIDDENNP